MKTLNGLPRSWDSFIQGICARKKLIKFSRLWEECSQEEARIVAREKKMGNEDQSLIVHSKKSRRNSHHSIEDDEPSTNRIRQESDDSSSDEEYVLISTLTGTITHGRNDSIIDSGASKQMTGFK